MTSLFQYDSSRRHPLYSRSACPYLQIRDIQETNRCVSFSLGGVSIFVFLVLLLLLQISRCGFPVYLCLDWCLRRFPGLGGPHLGVCRPGVPMLPWWARGPFGPGPGRACIGMCPAQLASRGRARPCARVHLSAARSGWFGVGFGRECKAAGALQLARTWPCGWPAAESELRPAPSTCGFFFSSQVVFVNTVCVIIIMCTMQNSRTRPQDEDTHDTTVDEQSETVVVRVPVHRKHINHACISECKRSSRERQHVRTNAVSSPALAAYIPHSMVAASSRPPLLLLCHSFLPTQLSGT